MSLKKKKSIPQTVEAFYECANFRYSCTCSGTSPNCVCSGGGIDSPNWGAVISGNNTNSSTNNRYGPDSSSNWS